MDNSAITWIDVEAGALACGPRPGKRSFPLLERTGCDAVLTLLAESEGARQIQAAVEQRHWRWFWTPIASATPTAAGSSEEARLRESLQAYVAELRAGRRVYIHCSAGLHRTGVIAAAVLMLADYPPHEVLSRLELMRPLTKQSLTQERWAWAGRIAGVDPGILPGSG